VVGGGASNSITSGGTSSTIAGGTSNTISGITATIGGGQTNTASGNKSTIPGGAYATTRGITGLLAYSSGKIASNGDAQFGKYVLKIQTTNATTATLTTDLGAASASNGIILPDNASYSFRGRLIARNTSTGDTSDWDVRGTIKRGVGASTAALVGTTTVTMVNQDSAASSWALAVSADTTLGGLKIAVTGVASTTISWVASIETVEVTN
jgi:hypothetical protein